VQHFKSDRKSIFVVITEDEGGVLGATARGGELSRKNVLQSF